MSGRRTLAQCIEWDKGWRSGHSGPTAGLSGELLHKYALKPEAGGRDILGQLLACQVNFKLVEYALKPEAYSQGGQRLEVGTFWANCWLVR